MDRKDIPFLTATKLGELIKSKEVSPVEAVEAYLDRIEEVDPRVNSYITVCHEEARQAAKESEAALARGEYRGPLHGVPVAVKDQLLTKGIRTTSGCTVYKDFVPDEDATVIAKLKEAGAVLLGKLNMVELASGGFTHAFTWARNPWDLSHGLGSSSTGSGAATAARLCATSLAEDTGGSVRWPAAFAGMVGMRPSWGRISRYGLLPGAWSMDTIGPISRTVEDCAITFHAISGYDPNDPYTWNTPVPDYRKALTGNIKGLKVGVVKEVMDSDQVEPDVKTVVKKAIDVLAGLGASVEEVSIPLVPHAVLISSLLRVDAPINYRDLIENHFDELGYENRVGFLRGSIIPAMAFFKAERLRSMLRQQVLQAFERFDVLVLPTSGEPPPIIPPEGERENGKQTRKSAGKCFTFMFSLASTPAISVCCGFTSDNLPIGLQIGGRNFDEETVFNVAYAYEQSNDWYKRVPPL